MDRRIDGRSHPLLKPVRAMIRSGELCDAGEILLETPRLIEDALASGISLSRLLVSEPLSQTAKKLRAKLPDHTGVFRVPRKIFETLSTTESSQGVLALAAAPQWSEQDLFSASARGAAPPERNCPLILLIAGVQDPGNLGTILRAAEAFGSTGAMLTRGTVSPWNAKALRASAGAVFRLPVLRDFSPAQAVKLLAGRGVSLYGAVARGGTKPGEIAATQALAVAIGSEAAGLPEEIARASIPLTIPMTPRAESLNVAIASAIILYEISRRRLSATDSTGDVAPQLLPKR